MTAYKIQLTIDLKSIETKMICLHMPWHVIQFVKSNSLKRILCGLKKCMSFLGFSLGKLLSAF